MLRAGPGDHAVVIVPDYQSMESLVVATATLGVEASVRVRRLDANRG